MKHITTIEARRHLAELLNQTAYGKERVVLTRRGKDLAALIPLEDLILLEEAEDLADVKKAMEVMQHADPAKRISLRDLAKELNILLN